MRVPHTTCALVKHSLAASFCQNRSSFVRFLISATRAFLLAWSWSTGQRPSSCCLKDYPGNLHKAELGWQTGAPTRIPEVELVKQKLIPDSFVIGQLACDLSPYSLKIMSWLMIISSQNESHFVKQSPRCCEMLLALWPSFSIFALAALTSAAHTFAFFPLSDLAVATSRQVSSTCSPLRH